MPVLKYFNGTAWTEVASPGQPGLKGPVGPPGPVGPAGAVVNLTDLTDVETSGVVEGDALVWDGTKSLWSPRVIPATHGELAGLADDDHPQYLNQTRGDARYAQLTTAASTVLGLSANYEDYGGSFAGLRITKAGDVVSLEVMVKVKVAHTVAPGATSLIGYVPAGFRPTHQLLSVMTTSTIGGFRYSRFDVEADGTVFLKNDSGVSFSMTVGSWVAPRATWRVAA